MNIPKFGVPDTNLSGDLICNNSGLLRGRLGSATSFGHENLSLTTLASDSSPFHEKYEVDEDAELLGEVRYNFSFESFISGILSPSANFYEAK